MQIGYRNGSTGQCGSAVVQTNHPGAVGGDGRAREQWLQGTRGELARQQGWAVEDTSVWVEEGRGASGGAAGGAIGIGLGDKVYMLENTWYSVISPESCSSILWRSWDYKEKAAEALKLTAKDMLSFGLIDGIIEEPLGGAHSDPEAMAEILKKHISETLDSLTPIPADELVTNRINKYSSMGAYDTVPEDTGVEESA